MTAVTWNPSDKQANLTLSEGNLKVSNISAIKRGLVRATLARSTGKWYFEAVVSHEDLGLGLAPGSVSVSTSDSILGVLTDCYGIDDNNVGNAHVQGRFSNTVYAYDNPTSTFPFTAMIAVDFDAGKIWFGHNGLWLTRRVPSVLAADPANGTGAAREDVAGKTLYPAATCHESNRPNYVWAHFNAASLTYTPPAGFSAWDDTPPPGVGSASGTSTVTGVGINPSVGSSDGTSTADGVGINISSGSSDGTSTAEGVGLPPASGSAAGTSTAAAVGSSTGRASGSAPGTSTAYAHPPITPNYLAGTPIQGATVTFNVNGGAYSAAAASINDDTRYGGGAGYSDYTHGSNVTQVKFSWGTPRWIAGAVIYSSDVLAGLAGEPTNETYTGANTSGHHGQSNAAWSIKGPGEVALSAPQIGADNLVKQVRLLDEIIYTDTLYVSGVQARIFEIQAIGTNKASIIEVQSTINFAARATLFSVTPATSTVNFISTLSGLETQTVVSSFNLVSALAAVKNATMVIASTFDITSPVELYRALSVASTFNVASSIPVIDVSLELASTVDLSSVASGLGTRKIELVSNFDLASFVDDWRGIVLASTFNITSPLDGIRRVSIADASSFNITATALAWILSTPEFTSSINLSSVVSGRIVAVQAFVSTVDLQSFILLPNGIVAALWCNPISTAAATWDGTPFESMIESDGAVYAAGSAGIYRLDDGVDDNGLPIAAYVMWDLLDFGDPKKHRPGSVVIGGFAAAPLKIRVVNEQGRFEYLTHLPANTKATNLRAKLGKGLNSRYNRFTLLNTGGKDFGFNDGSVEIVKLSRHIGGSHA